MTTYEEMAESEEMRQVRLAYAELDAQLLEAAKIEGSRFSLATRIKVTAAMMQCRRAIFGSLLSPEERAGPSEEEIERAYLERKIIPLVKR